MSSKTVLSLVGLLDLDTRCAEKDCVYCAVLLVVAVFVMGDREFQDTGDEECINNIQLSQDSQLSTLCISLSQDLSQGSADVDYTPSSSSKSKREEKEKKKKRKSSRRDKDKDKVRDREKSSKSKDKEGRGEKTKTTIHDDEQENCDREIRSKRSSKSHKSDKNDKSDKSERKHKKHSSRRPDPEGGNPSHFADSTISSIEYDRIINNTDPLFSDLENDPPEDESTKQPPRRPLRPPRTPKGAPAGAIFIPCTSLGINSNTMIKFAIIGTELQNIIQVSQRVCVDFI